MSIIQPKKFVEEGDLVIIYVNYKQTYALTVKKGETFQTRFGALRHEQLLGRSYGSKLDCTKGYVYVLCPTPELYTQNLSHRTQILYTQDIGLITTMLHLKPGMKLAEAGTGSGSLSHAAARTLAPNGLLYTFEVDATRFRLATVDFEKHGLTYLVKLAHRDVCTDGLGLSNEVDAVFLDLPRPWEVVASAVEAMKRDDVCRFCSFSPCIEQVQRTCEVLRRLNFVEVDVVECVPKAMRVFDVEYSPEYETSKNKDRRTDEETSKDEDEPPKKVAKLEENVQSEKKRASSYLSCIAYPPEQPTHTGYLTFATLLPRRRIET